MNLTTTCIGAWPKPANITTGAWAEAGSEIKPEQSRSFEYLTEASESDDVAALDEATCQAVLDQLTCGIDIPTDGEQRRENYIHYHCRHVQGIDFRKLTIKVHRCGAAVAPLPTVTASVRAMQHHFLDRDFRVAQAASDKPIKITIPGPLTIIDTTANEHYASEAELAFDLAEALNHEVLALVEAGCRHIQIDEPLFARRVDDALYFGMESLERCFHGVPEHVTRVMHMCCGYPGHLDDQHYLKADPNSYQRLATALDCANIDQVSLEDAHRHNDLALLDQFQNTTVILGCIAVASSQVESVEQIRERLRAALNHIDRDRLMAAPDCGMVMLDRNLAMAKLANLCAAAASI